MANLGCVFSQRAVVIFQPYLIEDKGEITVDGQFDNGVQGYQFLGNTTVLGDRLIIVGWFETRNNGPGDSDSYNVGLQSFSQHLSAPINFYPVNESVGQVIDVGVSNLVLDPEAGPPISVNISFRWELTVLGTEQVVKIKKQVLFSWITIHYTTDPLGNPIPDECAEAWINYILPRGNIPPDFDPIGETPSNRARIRRMCSDEGAPKPIVKLVCGDLDCPPDTCKVECGDGFCCYNEHGISVVSFVETLGE